MYLSRTKRNLALVVLCVAAATGAVGHGRLTARQPVAAPGAAVSARMPFRGGRPFLVMLARTGGFPAQAGAFRSVQCRFVPTQGPTETWTFLASAYERLSDASHAVFAFSARGLTSGTVHITVDDDEVGPIQVDPVTADPCATPGPVETKPRSPRGS
jgi:hypothetical protein